MVYSGWLELDEQEIINNVRAATHAANLGLPLADCTGCVNLPPALGHGPYYLPDTARNEAPWFDPAAPESARFAGVVGMEIAGLDKAVGSRSIDQTMPAGGVFGPYFETHRQIPVRVLLAAVGDDALSYGLSWLASAVRGELPPGCLGGTACVFASCPDSGNGDTQIRQLFGVDLIDAPAVTARYATSACGGRACYAEVEFTLAAAVPWIYYPPITVATAVPSSVVTVAESIETCVELNAGFPTNSLCPPPLIDVPPLIEDNPCWPLTDWEANRAVVSVPAGLHPGWFDVVPIVRITGSWGPRMSVRWYMNPLEEACSTVATGCPCSSMNLTHNGFESVITLDGRTSAATIFESSFAGTNEFPFLYGYRGQPFEWPIFECSRAMCVEILTSTATLGPAPTFDLSLAARVDAL